MNMILLRKPLFDPWLLLSAASLICIGLVMVASASIPIAEGYNLSPLYFTKHQLVAFALGLIAFCIVSYIPIRFWQKISFPLLWCSIIFLTILIIPGVSREVNGSVRWLRIGPISLQISEFVKLAFIIYIAGYLVRRQKEVQLNISGFLKPLFLLGVIAVLLLLEPDFGAVVVITGTVLGMLFLGGVPLIRFAMLFVFVLGALILVSFASPYRISRLTSFLDPWADQFNTGYQLTQSLIAFGRGAWFGTGLGGSVQKLLYLPEPHTDFLFAVLSEELGLIGGIIVLILFSILVMRALSIGRKAAIAKQYFAGHLAYGIGLWLSVQAMINIGVNIGVLPTKGLTLPLMSYGGNSLIVGLVALALLFRIDFEQRTKI